MKDLGIPRTAERIHIGFMGCAAALPALRSAARISELNRQAVVLVVCAELCSIHIRSSSDPEQIVASAVFGDGAAAAVVSSREERVRGPLLEIGEFATHVTDEGEGDLDWTIGDHGFEMRLSARVPRIIEHEISGVVNTVLRDSTDPARHVDVWAVHPGGRSVLDRAEAGLGLPDGALEHSRAVLRDYGNMSSATLLFILQRIMDDDALGDAASVAGLGFGPGLTVRETSGPTPSPAEPSADDSGVESCTQESCRCRNSGLMYRITVSTVGRGSPLTSARLGRMATTPCDRRTARSR